MEHLYIGSYIKKDKINDALHHAKITGHLHGVDDRSMRSFLEGFEEVLEERHGKFKDRIDHHEMEEIVTIMGRDHTDYVNGQELQTIATVLLDKDFVF